MRKINVIGTSGAGKSTFAGKLAKRLGVPHVQIDYLSWEPGWVQVSNDELRRRVQEAMRQPAWVIDGNYSALRELVWREIDSVIWLDYPLPLVMWRQFRRAGKRVFLREECCNGNYESLRRTFSRDSAWYWALTTYQRRRHQALELLARPEYKHLEVVHFTTPRQAQQWLRGLHQSTLVNDPLRVGD